MCHKLKVESSGLYNLLGQNPHAQKFYLKMPDYVQGMLQQHAHQIHSEAEMQEYVQGLYQNYE